MSEPWFKSFPFSSSYQHVQLSEIRPGDNQKATAPAAGFLMSMLMLRHEPKMILQVQSHHWSAKRSANNLRLVCSFWWTTSFNKTNSNKHRRTSRVADLNYSENVGSSALSQQRPSTHVFPTPHFSGSQLSVCYACGVCGMDTLKPHLISDVARLEWSLGICISHKHSRNWMAGPQAMSWKTLMCLQYVTKHCYCLWLHGKFYAKESIQIIVTETAHYTNLSAIT